MNIYTIYRIHNTINNKSYIGYTSDFDRRMADHKRNSTYKNTKLYCAIRKYGWSGFDCNIIYQSKEKEHTLLMMENFFINEYDSFYNGYNMTLGGGGILGLTINAGENNPMYGVEPWNKGKKLTQDIIDKIKEKRKLQVITEESNIKRSLKLKGKPRSVPHQEVTCPYCDRIGTKPMMVRWHFENCKNKGV